MASLPRDGGHPHVEFRIVRPSGEVRIVHSQGAAPKEVPGQLRLRFGTVQDITERKQAENKIRRLGPLAPDRSEARRMTARMAACKSRLVCETENFSVDESWLSRRPLATEPNSRLALSKKLPSHEKAIIEAALRESGGRASGPSGAAVKLGIPGSTLDSKIRSLKINKNRFRA